jgi:hypothetical protein
MSFSGKFTPLQLNTLGALSQEQGFNINVSASYRQGTWYPGTTNTYNQGTVTSTTVLNKLTQALPLLYQAKSTNKITAATYRRLLRIGSGVCPALGNSRPDTFKPSYAGYGSWEGGVMKRASYPPKGNYDTDRAQWLNGTTSYSKISQDNAGKYGWITRWPSTSSNEWQKYDYAVEDTAEYDEYFSNGFIGTLARQAYYEMYYGTFNQYSNIVNSFSQNKSYRDIKNNVIGSYVNSKTFMSGTYSNINDITTSNISGITLAFKDFGNDFIATGRAIDLKNISKFGLPSVLLKTLQKNNVLTPAVKLALMYQELSIIEIDDILKDSSLPTVSQEQKIYTALTLISGDDLFSAERGVLYGLNVDTDVIKLDTLADLLDPRKLFPTSHNSLTLPRYNIDRSISTSAKIYDFIYINSGVNARIENWGSYLDGILSEDLAVACGAFAMTLQQVKFISNMEVEKFSQVVANLELTNLNLPQVNTTNGMSVDPTLTETMLQNTGLGSGNNGTFRQCDFYGSAAGYPSAYEDSEWFFAIIKFITRLTNGNSELSSAYDTILSIANSSSPSDSALDLAITAANTAITNIFNKNVDQCKQLNYFWDKVGNQLFIEQRAIPLAIPNPQDLIASYTNDDILNFVRQLETYSLDNGDGMSAIILERIADIKNTNTDIAKAAQNLVATMREARNAQRIGLMSGEVQNNVSGYIDVCSASAKATVVSGKITSVKVTNRSTGYLSSNLPTITVYPVNVDTQAILTPVIALDGSISSILIKRGGVGYDPDTTEIVIEPPPQCQPANEPQQTYADTPHSQLVEPELTTPSSASPDVATAISEVTTCNCDCWTA